MSTTAKLRSIRCTSCAAPLPLHGGGHKILTLNCHYCGAVMDARHDYALLAQFKNQTKPNCPLEIGMQGTLKGVVFTVIGMLALRAENVWVDLLLFSPTHGYAWLSYEQGHFTFARRTRTCLPSQLRNTTPKAVIQTAEQRFRTYETYDAEIVYVAGELTWLAKVGDVSRITEAIAPPLFLSGEFSDKEGEIYLGEYVEPEVIRTSFQLGDKPLTKPSTLHAAQPFHAPWLAALSRVSKTFALFWLAVVAVIALFLSGHQVYRQSFDLARLKTAAQTTEFTINKANRLVELNLKTNLRNAWTFFEVSLLHSGKEIYSIGKEVSYYEGYEDGESWSEGSREANALFKVPEAGQYTLKITAPEGGTNETGQTSPTGSVDIEIREGFVSKRYFLMLLGLAVLGFLLYPIRHWQFEAKRWAEVDDE